MLTPENRATAFFPRIWTFYQARPEEWGTLLGAELRLYRHEVGRGLSDRASITIKPFESQHRWAMDSIVFYDFAKSRRESLLLGQLNCPKIYDTPTV
jgi:hypothetical protein